MHPMYTPGQQESQLEVKSRERVAEHERRAREVELRTRLLADDDRPRKPGIVDRILRSLRRR
jgi:hypothetical protein